MPDPKPAGELQRPAGQQLHDVAVMLANLVERLAGGNYPAQLRADALAGLSAARHIIEKHETPMPDLVELARELRAMMTMTEARIQVRARAFADEVILAERAAGEERYAELQRDRQRDKNRSDDLETEMRRQMFAMERGRAIYANALLDVVDRLVTVRAGNETVDALKDGIADTISVVRSQVSRRFPVPEKRSQTIRERCREEEQRATSGA